MTTSASHAQALGDRVAMLCAGERMEDVLRAVVTMLAASIAYAAPDQATAIAACDAAARDLRGMIVDDWEFYRRQRAAGAAVLKSGNA